MWIATEHGYFSSVADRYEPNGPYVWVRARAAKDLIEVRELGYDIGTVVGKTDADYPYRAKVRREVWAAYVADQINSFDYTNFKNRVSAVDHDRARVYMNVWWELGDIEDADPDREGVAEVNAAEGVRA